MRIAINLDISSSVDTTIARVTEVRERGFNATWSSQIFGPDTLTVLAVVGHEVRDVDLGTAVVPIQPRHPWVMAAQARTVQEAIGGRLSLGVGLSHQSLVEDMWGLPFDRPASYMREYLETLAPMLRGEAVATTGERVHVTSFGAVGPREVRTPDLLVAALGPKMLETAGQLCDGTLLWMTGVNTIANHVTPTITAAAAAAGRSAPRIIASLPIAITSDVEATKAMINERLAVYGTLPSYRAMLDREGAANPADIAILGSRQQVLEQIVALADAGATEFSAAIYADGDAKDEIYDVLREYRSLG